jgi:glycosyltransferase involved in cell wall biosynthesis
MKLSVVMAVRNGERHLADAVNSVLNQTFDDFEFLIVDDASTDRTSTILADFAHRDSRIRILTNRTNLGPYPSANRAIGEAVGAAIARQDADDISPPDRFAVQWQALTSSEHVTLVTGRHERFGSRGQRDAEVVKPPDPQPVLEWTLLFSNSVGTGALTMFPRVVDGTAIAYPARFRYAEDYELICRLAALGRVVSPQTVVYRYRQHESSITRTQRTEQDQCVAAIRQERLSRYLPTPLPSALATDAALFWLCEGGRPLGSSAHDILAMLRELRPAFLDDIALRHGRQAQSILDEQIERSLQERIGYWIYRSFRFGDHRAARTLLRAAGEGNPIRACLSALQYGGVAVRQRVS